MIRVLRGASLGILASVLTLALASGACTSAVKAPADTTNEAAVQSGSSAEVTVEVSEWKFSPSSITVPAGTSVKVTLVNKGVIEHDIHIPDYHFHLHTDAGKSETARFIADQTGEFVLECTLPGHSEAGMVGKLIVTR